MLEVTTAGIKDVELIRTLAFTIWPDAYRDILSTDQLAYMLGLIYSTASLTSQVEKLQHRFIIAKENNIVVAFASYAPKEQHDHSVYRLHKLYVLPDRQQKGTGKFLLDYIIDEIKRSGAKMLELNVNRHNKALNFYTRMGFTISREEDIDIGGGYFMNDYVMECKM